MSDSNEKLESLNGTKAYLALVDRADLRPGALRLQLARQALADVLACQPDLINATALTVEAPFRMRRRGVELKLHLGDPAPEIDLTLVQNIEKARCWLAMIIDGRTFTEIATSESVSKRRIQDLVDLALLAPDVLDAIASGEQSEGLTTDYLIKTGFDPVWSAQRKQFADL